jgi:hypothetical protein
MVNWVLIWATFILLIMISNKYIFLFYQEIYYKVTQKEIPQYIDEKAAKPDVLRQFGDFSLLIHRFFTTVSRSSSISEG